MLATALAILLAAAPASPAKLPLRACTVQGVAAKCGTLLVPENRDSGIGARIGLRIVVVPARRKPAQGRRLHVPRGRARRRSDPADRGCELDLESGARATRHPARRPARHRRLASACLPAAAGGLGRRRDDQGLHRVAERRLDAVRVGCRRGRPRSRPCRARIPVTRPLRHLLRRNARAGLPGSAPAFGADGGPGRGDAARCLLLGPFRGQRRARARPDGEALRARARVRACIPELAGAAPLADRGLEREARAGRTRADAHRGRPRRVDPVHDVERSVGGLDPARRHTRRTRRLCAAFEADSEQRRREPADVLVDLVQRALGRARREWAVAHLPRWLCRHSARALPLRVCVRAGLTPSRRRTTRASARTCRCLHSLAAPTRRIPQATSPGSARRCRRRASWSSPSTATVWVTTAACRTLSRSLSTEPAQPRSTRGVSARSRRLRSHSARTGRAFRRPRRGRC